MKGFYVSLLLIVAVLAARSASQRPTRTKSGAPPSKRGGPPPKPANNPRKSGAGGEREVEREGSAPKRGRRPQSPAPAPPAAPVPPAAPTGRRPCNFAPVCASDGYTYLSECFIWAGATKACDGVCPCPVAPLPPPMPERPYRPPQRPARRPARRQPVCRCPLHLPYAPVCGADGNTYDNDCERRCNGIAKQCDRGCPCRRSCTDFCSSVYSPECGKDGNTYNNECHRNCRGVERQCKGVCPCEQEPQAPPTLSCQEQCWWDRDPVCSMDGDDIRSECHALCEGIAIQCKDRCPC